MRKRNRGAEIENAQMAETKKNKQTNKSPVRNTLLKKKLQIISNKYIEQQ